MALRHLIPVLTALLLVSACGDDEARTATPSPSPTSTTAAPSPSPSPDVEAEVDQVVDEFLDALGVSGSRRAWELLSSRSQEGFGSFEAFDDLSTDYAEGLAAFREADRDVTELTQDLTVVTLSGEVTREGMTETDAYALPVRHEDGRPRVELTPARLPILIDIEVPPGTGEAVDGDAELRAIVPASSRPTVVLDGAVHPADQEPADGDRTRVTLTPELEPGPHVLAVAAVRDDGLLLAQAVAFTVD